MRGWVKNNYAKSLAASRVTRNTTHSPYRRGWFQESYRHSLAARRIKIHKLAKPSKVQVNDGDAIVRKRGQLYRVELKSKDQDAEKRELARLAKLPLSEIKRRYKNKVSDEDYESEKGNAGNYMGSGVL
jgi:hypothetical protein